jgi:protein ImuA
VPELDQRIGGLDQAGVHEIKPAVPGPGVPAAMGMAAAFVFALRLAARRVLDGTRQRTGAAGHISENGVILLCMPARDRLELGRLYGPGVAALGLDARQFLIVETAKAADTLWAMEEGLRSQVPAIVIGCLDELPLTPARRLSLAADQYLTPCIAVTGARTPAAGATASRWRIGAAQTGANSLDTDSPGLASCVAALERCRHRVDAGEGEALTLEWCDETFRFRLAPQMADRETAARPAGAGA